MNNQEKVELYMEITEIAESIAYANSDFYCTKCLDTIDRLCEIVRKHCGYDLYIVLHNICDKIMNEEEYEESEDEE